VAGLEVQTGKVPGTEIRRTPASRPAFIGFLILVLAAIELVFVGLVFTAIGNGANDAAAHDPAIPNSSINMGFQRIEFFLNEQTIISFWISIIFFSLWYMIFLYQRFFKDHVTINKKRFRKWEDEGVQLHD
jgi:beta-lactamase regulating signal transducer with metallopeptidase domain